MDIVNVMEAMVRYDLWKQHTLDDLDLIDELFLPRWQKIPVRSTSAFIVI